MVRPLPSSFPHARVAAVGCFRAQWVLTKTCWAASIGFPPLHSVVGRRALTFFGVSIGSVFDFYLIRWIELLFVGFSGMCWSVEEEMELELHWVKELEITWA
jgi:hypothetical protein